jgi:sugar phosphate isomerase/epimerase
MKEPDTRIAVTLFNVRKHCKTLEDLDATLKRLSDIGYRAVQISAIPDYPPEAVRELLDKHGMFCCATHEKLDACLGDVEKIAARLKVYGCDFAALGSPGQDFLNDDRAPELPGVLENISREFSEHGIRFGFHNHHRELEKFGARTLLDEIYARTSGLCAEIDVHWIQRGGGNPVSWIRRVAGRMPVVHLKDYSIVNGEPAFSEIGQGNLEWNEILAALRETEVRWYVVEQDKPAGDRDIFDSMEISYKKLVELGADKL